MRALLCPYYKVAKMQTIATGGDPKKIPDTFEFCNRKGCAMWDEWDNKCSFKLFSKINVTITEKPKKKTTKEITKKEPLK